MTVFIRFFDIHYLKRKSFSWKERKKELIKSVAEREVLENRELIKIAEKVFKLEDAVKCVIEDEKIIL